jgi:hypothetical protein
MAGAPQKAQVNLAVGSTSGNPNRYFPLAVKDGNEFIASASFSLLAWFMVRTPILLFFFFP